MKIGTLEVTDKLFISDPCYDKDTWCTQTVELPFGKYNCYADYQEGRVASLYIVNNKYRLKNCFVTPSEEIGTCGVDSGQLGIFNYNKFKESIDKKTFDKSLKNEFPYEDWKREYNEKDNAETTFYKCCCNHTLNKKHVGIIKNVGIVSSSGYGDGSYPVYPMQVCYPDRRETVGVYVEFM